MVLDIPGSLFGKSIFKSSPEDGDIDVSEGPRRVPQAQTVLLTPLENELNILDLQESTAITPVTYSGSRTDIFSDADGFVDSVDTANTTARFDTDKYTNEKTIDEDATENSTTADINPGVLVKTFSDIDRTILFCTNEIFTDWGVGRAGNCKYKFYYDDATDDEVENNTDSTSYVSKTYTNPEPTKTVSTIEVRIGIASPNGSAKSWAKNDKVFGYGDTIVQTDMHTIGSGAKTFQVIAYRNATAGTGTITADISFNNGTNYLTDVPLDTNTTIINRGTQLILKLKLNGISTGNTAECKGYGVAFWGGD